ncbi:MAG TPA: methyltransferase domain-containing protein, partial [bacterium]
MPLTNKSEKTISNTWDRVWKEIPILPWEKDFISQLVYRAVDQEIGNAQKLNILEAGCGTGRISIRLANGERSVTLLDSSVAALRLAQKFAQGNNTNIAFVNNSIYNICFRDNSFDVVWNAGVLEHFYEDEQRTIVNEMFRVCRESGTIIILVPYSKAVLYRIGK